MNKTLIALAAVLGLGMLYSVTSEAQTPPAQLDGHTAGMITYQTPVDWLVVAGAEPYIMFPAVGLPGELVTTNFGPLFSDSIPEVPGELDPEPHVVLPPVSSWVTNPGVETYLVALWLMDDSPPIEVRAYGTAGILFQTERLLFSFTCNHGTRFCGARSAARITRIEIESTDIVRLNGMGLGESDLSPPSWECPVGMVNHRLGGVALYWQADVPAKVAAVENNGCLILDLDRPGEDYGYFAVKTGVFQP